MSEPEEKQANDNINPSTREKVDLIGEGSIDESSEPERQRAYDNVDTSTKEAVNSIGKHQLTD